jgi:lysozyme family protein
MEWTFKPKSKIQKMKDKVSDFTNWLREDDPEIDWSDFSDGINPQNPIIMFKNFIEKIKDKEKIKEYFIRVIKQIKSLPTNIKRDLLKKLLIILAVYCNTINVPLSNIVTSDVTKTEPITAEIMTEIESGKEQQSTIKSNVDKKTSNVANFEMAQKMVKTAEAGYSDDRKDTGNYFEVPGGGYRFIGTNHGVSAPVLYQYFKDKGIDRLPTKQDMIDLTYDVALEIFKKDYWDRQHLGEIKNQPIATILYDGCINQGPGKFGGKEGVAEPLAKALVKIGEERPDSWSEVPSIVNGIEDEKDLKSLFKCIKRERWNRYSDAGTFDTHGDGWKNRLNNITYNKTIDTDKYDSEKDDVENDLSELYGKLS